MFPWYAGLTDSRTSQLFSVAPGDVADLIHTPGFVRRYVESANHLFDAKRIGGASPVNGTRPFHVSPDTRIIPGLAYDLMCPLS